MKIKFITIIFLFISQLSVAQYNTFPKLEDLFNSGDFEGCIAKADKYSKKDKKQALPYYYRAFSYFELFKKKEDENEKNKFLKKALANSKIAQYKDRNSNFETKFKAQATALHEATKNFANDIYEKDKEKSNYFYKQLVSVFQDTTYQYKELNGLLDNNTSSNSVGIDLESKSKIGPNLTDEKGLRQGLWRKIYPNGEIAYEVRFKNNQPTGVMKRYYKNGKLSAVLDYGAKGGKFCSVILYDKNELKVAEGFYYGHEKDSTWQYYSTNKNLAEAEAEELKLTVVERQINYKISEENYDKGVLDGVSTKFFPSGNISEFETYKQGVLEGLAKEYFTNGTVKVEYRNFNSRRYGAFNQYYRNGRPEITGYYVGSHRHGKWTYYTSTGEIEKEIQYLYGVAKNQDELEDQETKQLKEFEKNKGKLDDPANYMDDPNSFIRQFQR